MEEPRCIVKFIAHDSGYNAGERAGFPYERAAALVRAGKAILVDDKVSLADIGIAEGEEEKTDARAPDESVQGMTTAVVKQLAEQTTDIHKLYALWEGEKTNPNYPGGRRGVLDILRKRAGELVDETK
jgi:hypothetical protein